MKKANYSDKLTQEMARLANQILHNTGSANYIYHISKLDYELEKKKYDLERKQYDLNKKAFNTTTILTKTIQKVNSFAGKASTVSAKVQNHFKGRPLSQSLGLKDDMGNNRVSLAMTRMSRKMEQSVELLKSIYIVQKAVSTLAKIPSALGAVLKILEFGILFLFKPLADLLAIILMPIAINIIKLGLWFNGLDKTSKLIVGILEGIALFFAGYFGLFGETIQKAIQKLVDFFGKFLGKAGKFGGEALEGAEKLAGKISKYVGEVFDSVVGKISIGAEKLASWLERSRLPTILNEFAEKIEKSWIGRALDTLASKINLYAESLEKSWLGKALDSFATKITSLGEWISKSPLKSAFDSVAEKIGIFKEAVEKKASGAIELVAKKLNGFGDLIESFVSKGFFSKLINFLDNDLMALLTKALGVIGKGFEYGTIDLIAYIISWISGWLAEKLGADNPLKYLFQFISDLTLVIAKIFDPIKWIIDALEDIYALLNGDLSFKNLANELYNVGVDILNVWVDVYNWHASLLNKLGFHIDLLDRINEKELVVDNKEANHSSIMDGINGFLGGIRNSVSSIFSSMTTIDEQFKGFQHTNSTTNNWVDENGYGHTSDGTEGSNKYGSYTDSTGATTYRVMAAGGIVTSPVKALIGEAGAEAVIPLNKLDQYIGTSGSKNTSQPINITFSGIVDENRFRNIINEEATKIFNSYKRVSGTMW